MKRIAKIANMICALLMLAALPAELQAVKTDSSGARWKYHTSFDSQPRKVIDTPDVVYFFVHQHLYRTDVPIYQEAAGGVFVYDKRHPEAGIVDLQSLADMSGANMALAEYNPTGRYLIVVYNDGDIDIVDENYQVTNLPTLKGHNYPGLSSALSVTFDHNSADAWVGTKGGFLKIDGAKRRPHHIAMWENSVQSICSVEGGYFAIIDGSLHYAPAESNPSLIASYAAVSGATNAGGLMPLGGNCVAYVRAGGSMCYVTTDGTSPSAPIELGKDGDICQTNGSTIVKGNLDHTIQRTARGYLVNGRNNAYQIVRPASPGEAPTLEKRTHTQNSTYYAGSWNFTDFWFYQNRGKFLPRTAKGESEWEAAGTPLSPSAPLTSALAYFSYSPEVGLVTSNAIPTWETWTTGRLSPMLLTSYRNGKWSNIAPCYYTPKMVSENSAISNTFYAQAQGRYPVSDPDGFAVDPLYPKWLHVGSLNDGFASVDLTNPRADAIMHTDSKNPLSNFSAIKDLPNQGGNNYTGTRIMGFDGDNNLWMLRSNYQGSAYKGDIYLWCWTPDARKEALESGDYTKADNWIKLQYPLNMPWSWAWSFGYKAGVACKHPSNRNKLVLYMDITQPIMIYDHKGTLDDVSDDEVTMLRQFVSDQTGNPVSNCFTKDIVEDPATGDIYIYDLFFTGRFNLNSPVDELGRIKCDFLNADQDNTEERATLDTHGGSQFSFDEYGRLWYAQGTNGVTCLSADKKRVVYRWSIGNSPLPGEYVFACGWNPETKSVFLSTECGIVEVQPDMLEGISEADTEVPYAKPSIVNSDFAGTVALYNVPKGSGLRVKDAKGATVRLLEADFSGIGSWDLLDANGKRVPAGRYLITDPSLSFADIEIIVTR